MKKYIYLVLAFLSAAACTKALEEPVDFFTDDLEEGPLVTVEFSLPPVTKGTMAHDPTITTIHVAVFNQAGVLKQFEKAKLANTENLINGNNTTDGNPTYSVEIHMSSKKRILHFIADSPIDTYEALIEAAGTSGEDVILNALTTSGGATAYWQRVELDKIDAYTYKGGVCPYWADTTEESVSYSYTENNQTITVYAGDYIKRNGHKVLDGTGYFQSDYVAGKVANIAFIRNFAEITVSKATSGNFTPKKFALVNVPKAGYVAPYDSKKGQFCTAYTGTETLSHSAIYDTSYPGTLVGGIDPSLPTSFIDLTSTATGAVKTAYMYERTIPNPQQPATCILVAGEFNENGAQKDSDGNTWFKIEIADETGTYFPVYRGISYDIKIGAISGTKGYASAQAAYNADPIGDISGSVTTATLEQISDGKGTTLWVEYIDYVATEAETKTIYYTMYYQPTAGGTITYLTNNVNLSVSHPDDNYKAITSEAVTGSQYSGTGTPDDTKTWYVATVPLDESGSAAKHSVLHVEGTTPAATGSKKMYRDVNYRVMGTQHFQNGENVLKASPLPTEASGEMTTLTIYLPSDLGFSMFPLTLRIEAQNGNFTTVDGLPVESGPSLFNTSTSQKNAFYFLKTIEYEDYYNAATGVTTTAFQTRFKTTRDGTTSAAGTNATYFRVLDKVKTGRTTTYFDTAQCYVSVGGPVFELASNAVSVKADVTSVSFAITSTGDTNPQWTLTASDNITSLSQNSGSGNATITVEFPANDSETDDVTYTVTATRTGFDDQVFTITQAKKDTKYYTINLDAGRDDNTYGFPWGSSSVNPDSNGYYSYQSNNEGYNSTIATMSVTVVGYTQFTVYIRSNAESSYDYIVVRNLDASALTSWNNATSGAKDHTSGRQSSGTAINNYRKVTFTTADGLTDDDTPHTFYIQFGKDYWVASGDDRGYVLIPKEYVLISNNL